MDTRDVIWANSVLINLIDSSRFNQVYLFRASSTDYSTCNAQLGPWGPVSKQNSGLVNVSRWKKTHWSHHDEVLCSDDHLFVKSKHKPNAAQQTDFQKLPLTGCVILFCILFVIITVGLSPVLHEIYHLSESSVTHTFLLSLFPPLFPPFLAPPPVPPAFSPFSPAVKPIKCSQRVDCPLSCWEKFMW